MSNILFPEREAGRASDSANLTIPEGPGRWVSDREMEALDALHAGEVRELEQRSFELGMDNARLVAELHRTRAALRTQWTYACTCGDYDEHRLPGPHDIDTTFATRAEAEADAEKWHTETGLPYMVLRRQVTAWEVVETVSGGRRVVYPTNLERDGLHQDDMCPNCVTPRKRNGPHLPPGLHDLDDVIAELGIDLSEDNEVQP